MTYSLVLFLLFAPLIGAVLWTEGGPLADGRVTFVPVLGENKGRRWPG